jgi:hypothetical protein
VTTDTTGRTPLKFGVEPRTNATVAASRGDEAATVRYDDEKGLAAGDELSLRTATGDAFGTATVTAVRECKVFEAVPAIRQRNARHSCATMDQLLSALNKHYEPVIAGATPVTVVFFEPTVHTAREVEYAE